MITKEALLALFKDFGQELKDSTVEAIRTEVEAAEKRGEDKVTALQESIDKRLTAVEERGVSRPIGAVSLPGCDEEKDEFKFCRAFAAIAFKDETIAPFEMDVMREARKRALTTGTDSAGGYVVPTQYVAQLIELFRAQLVVEAAGATVETGWTGSPVEIPKQTGGATAAWIGEGSAITPSDQSLGQLSLTPNQLGAATTMSRRLDMLSNPAMEGIVRRDLARVMALKTDLAALRGSGSSNEPTGVANTASIGTNPVGTNGGAITYALLQKFVTTLDTANALNMGASWIFHPAMRENIATLVDGDTRPLFVDTLAQTSGADGPGRVQNSLIGYNWRTTTQIPVNLTKGSGTGLTEVYFGNWQELIIAMWGGMEIMASLEAEDVFLKNQMLIRAIAEIDIGVRHPESFVLMNDATA